MTCLIWKKLIKNKPKLTKKLLFGGKISNNGLKQAFKYRISMICKYVRSYVNKDMAVIMILEWDYLVSIKVLDD